MKFNHKFIHVYFTIIKHINEKKIFQIIDENIKIEISETNRGKEQIIINKKYKYNFSKLII